MSVVIETRNLTKVYEGTIKSQDVHALEKLNLTIHSGEIFGYLGPNGSGKTTTIKLLLGLIFPTSGEIEILGTKNIGSPTVRRRIGYLPEGAYYPDFLRGEEVLSFYGHLYGVGGSELRKRIDWAIETVGIQHARKRLIRGYSKGMRQRIGLAQALLGNPDILILDEPTTGLDPIARKEIRDILANLRDQGKTLLISSHELLEVELITNRVGILSRGVLQTSGTLDELLVNRDVLIHVDSPSQPALDKFGSAGIEVEDKVQGKVILHVPEKVSVYDALEICRAEKTNLVSIMPRRETLEELYVRIVSGAERAQRGA